MTHRAALRAQLPPATPTAPASRAVPTAVVVIAGDDVYEDLFTAGLKLTGLLAAGGFATSTVMGTARLTTTPIPDLIILYTAMGDFPPRTQTALAEVIRAGAGLIAVHAANVFPTANGGLHRDYRTAFDLIGSRYASHGPRPHESRFRVQADQHHPLTSGLAPFDITHEHYHLDLAPDAQCLAWRTSADSATREPVLHVRPEGDGRVCYLQLGHDMRTWDDPGVQDLLARCARWSARAPRRPQTTIQEAPR